MLMNDFYSISDLVAGENNVTCTANFNPEHQIFNGHFPGQPVVPGVCMMQMVKELLQQQLGKELLLRSTGQVKFLQLITPEVAPQIAITWSAQNEGYQVTALFKGERDLFKLTGAYEVKVRK